MFICNNCTQQRSISGSYGQCENCHKTGRCNDLPADHALVLERASKDMTDEPDTPIALADLDAMELLDIYGPHTPDRDAVHLHYVDDQTILAVGFGRALVGFRLPATGRVAHLVRSRGGWFWPGNLAERPRSINTYDDLVDLVAWLRGDS